MAHRLLGTSGKESFFLLKVWLIIFCNVYNTMCTMHCHHFLVIDYSSTNNITTTTTIIIKITITTTNDINIKTITIRRSFPFFFSSSSLWPCFRSPCCSLQKIFWTMPPCCSLQKYFLNFLNLFSAFSILPNWCALDNQCKTITQNLCLCRASETLKWSHHCPNYQALHESKS